MPHEEVYGQRDLSFSAWHRAESTARFLPMDQAKLLTMIDIDAALWCEAGAFRRPVALMETARDFGQNFKPATIIRNLAQAASLPAYKVFYQLSDNPNPTSPSWRDISRFRVERLCPTAAFREFTPQEFAEWLRDLRLRQIPT